MRININLIKGIFVLGLIMFIDAVVYEPYALKITSYNLTNPSLSGIKIVFATDFHVAPYKWEKWRLQRVINTINGQNPDLVILGGDYVNRHSKMTTMSPKDITETLRQITAPKVAVLGNHDSYYNKEEVKAAFEGEEIPVLSNLNIKLTLQNRDIYVAGVNDYDTDRADVEKALEGVGLPLIFVTHSPDVFVELNGRADIAFAGHTHGGQVVLPFLGAVAVITKTGKKCIHGLFYEKGKPLIVSSGLGTSLLPIRFNNLPEIVVVKFD